MDTISQREARRFRKRVAQLELAEELRRTSWASDWPGGVEIRRLQWATEDPDLAAIITARKLRHAVIVIADNAGLVRLIALPVAK